MGEMSGRPLTRDELALVRYYRELPVCKQLEILECAEASCNAARRMEELAGRGGGKRFPADEAHWA